MEISQVSDSRPGWGRLLHLENTGFRFLGLLGVGLCLHPPDLALKVFRRKTMLSFWEEGWGGVGDGDIFQSSSGLENSV